MAMQLLAMNSILYRVGSGTVVWDFNYYSKSYEVLKTVQPEVKMSKVSFHILNRSLSDFAMTMQLLAMDSTAHSDGGGAFVLDFNHYSKSY